LWLLPLGAGLPGQAAAQIEHSLMHSANTAQVSIALQMVLSLDGVECRCET
jgi:hypothetical protein